jgi:hypothetical protein
MVIGDIASGIAALAALVTIYYARATVLQAREARREASAAHSEEMDREAQLLEETQAAYEQEMAARKLALQRELWLQRLAQLGKLQDLLWEAADIARSEISNPPERIEGQPGTWTRLTGVLLRVEAGLVSLELLEGPSLPKIKQMAGECQQMHTPAARVVSETMSALQITLHLAESDAAFKAPGDED